MSTPFVVILGMGTVFAGLIVIILLCKLMSFFVGITEKNTVTEASAPAAPAAQTPVEAIQDKGSVIAAISAVVAEELGTDITNIRIHSIKRV